MDTLELINRYCAAWSDPQPEVRAALLESVWAPGATYTDPRAHTTGAGELLAHIAKVHASRPHSRVVRTTALDTHHGMLRFGWKAVDAAGATLVEGIDVVFLSADATRIERIAGFFGPLAPI